MSLLYDSKFISLLNLFVRKPNYAISYEDYFHLHFHFNVSAPETYSGFDKTMILFLKFSPTYMEKDRNYWLGTKKANRYLKFLYHPMLLLIRFTV